MEHIEMQMRPMNLPTIDDLPSPLVLEAHACWEAERVSFHMPGHCGGAGAFQPAVTILGQAAFRADLSEIGGFDYLHAPRGNMSRAQAEAARLCGAHRSFFLVNGSTAGNIAALMACASDGEKVLVCRSSHQSVFAGLIFTGAVPVYFGTVYHPELDAHWGLNLTELEHALTTVPQIKAIHLTRPNYYGICTDIACVTEMAKDCQIPTIVDEAHGAHFAFHESFPRPALRYGANLVIQSAHKTLCALTQGAVLHVGYRDATDEQRLLQILRMTQTSSPSALILISLDIAYAQMRTRGFDLMCRTLELADLARTQINAIEELVCYGDEILGTYGIDDYDRTKLVVDLNRIGITGFKAAAWLRQHRGIGIEMADLRRIVCSINISHNQHDVGQLVDSMWALSKEFRGEAGSKCRSPVMPLPDRPEIAMPPRRALFARCRELPISQATGAVSAEFVTPYPPAIPLVVPGEIVPIDLVDHCKRLEDLGCRITGLADSSLATIRIVDL